MQIFYSFNVIKWQSAKPQRRQLTKYRRSSVWFSKVKDVLHFHDVKAVSPGVIPPTLRGYQLQWKTTFSVGLVQKLRRLCLNLCRH